MKRRTLTSWSRETKSAKVRMLAVVWTDSTTVDDGTWRPRTDTHNLGPQMCVSVGFLLRQTKACVVLCLSLTDQQAGNVMSIPRVAIRGMYDLVEGDGG